MIQFDVVLVDVGGYGLAQVIYALLLAFVKVPAAFTGLFTVFGAYTPDYRCNVPPLDNSSVYPDLSESDILNLTTPYNADKSEYSTCYRYGFDLDECTGSTSCANQSYPIIKCDQGYHYDRTLFDETTVTEFNLVCDQRYWEALSSSIYYAGMLVGSFIGGLAADAFGRKRCFMVGFVPLLGCTFGIAFARSLILYNILRFFIGVISTGMLIISYVYVVEIVRRDWRTYFSLGIDMYWAFGTIIFSGVAYYWKDWHEMMFVCGIITIPCAIALFVVPESPRWLLTKGRETEGIEALERMARINKRKISKETWKKARKAGEEISEKTVKRHYTCLDMFRSKRMRMITVLCGFIWFVDSFVYYGIALNAGALAGDIFVNDVLNGVLELAAYLVVIVLLNRIGRRVLLITSMLMAGFGMLANVVVNAYAGEDQGLITFGVVLAFTAKFGISISFAVTYILTAELYPTVVRTNGVGFGSTLSRIGGIVAPFMISLQEYAEWLPNTIFGIFGVVAGVLSLYFPETNGRPMTETIEEAEEFYKNAKYQIVQSEDDEESSTDLPRAYQFVGAAKF